MSEIQQLSTDDGLCVYVVKETPSNLLHGEQGIRGDARLLYHWHLLLDSNIDQI